MDKPCNQASTPEPTDRSCASQVFDQAALAKLRELDPGGRRGFVAQVFRAYRASLAKHLERLGPAGAVAVDPAVAAEVAHTLKSSSAAVGALAFAASCSALEKGIKAGRIGDILPALDALRLEAADVLQGVQAMLGD